MRYNLCNVKNTICKKGNELFIFHKEIAQTFIETRTINFNVIRETIQK